MSCEAYYTEADLIDGNCPIHGRPVEHVTEENYFFKLSRYEQRLLDWYDQHPDFVQADRRNEALGLHPLGLQDFSICRTSLTWGIPLPWDPGHVNYVWFDALTNYITAVGYGTDDERVRRRGGRAPTSSARTSSASTASTGRRCCCRPAWRRRVAGRSAASSSWRREDEQDDRQPDRPRRPRRRLRRRRLPLPLPRRPAVGADGDFSYEGMVARYNADLANNLGNLLARVATVVGRKCDGIGPAPRPDSPLAEAAADGRRRHPRRRGPRCSRSRRPGRHLAAGAGHQRLPGEPTSRGRPSPGPAVDAVLGDALEALRIVAILASPAMPSRPRPSGTASGWPAAVRTSACPRRPRGAATRAACRS